MVRGGVRAETGAVVFQERARGGEPRVEGQHGRGVELDVCAGYLSGQPPVVGVPVVRLIRRRRVDRDRPAGRDVGAVSRRRTEVVVGGVIFLNKDHDMGNRVPQRRCRHRVRPSSVAAATIQPQLNRQRDRLDRIRVVCALGEETGSWRSYNTHRPHRTLSQHHPTQGPSRAPRRQHARPTTRPARRPDPRVFAGRVR
jgi:hypothetical protein